MPCTTILVGRNASYDGSTIVARNEDSPSGTFEPKQFVVVDPDGAPCSCGGRGCVETIAGGPRMARWARENGWEAPAEADAKELAQAAGDGHPVALRAFRRSARALAAMIASVLRVTS